LAEFVADGGLWAGAVTDPLPAQFVALRTLGMFLIMAAACLRWASKKKADRAPVIFWQGLVRLVAVSSILYAVPNGLPQPVEYAVVVFDGVIGLTYVIGMMRVTGLSIPGLLMCKPPLNQG